MRAYPYGTGNRLEDRNTYYYSSFIGRDLFIFWKHQREDALQVGPRSSPCLWEEKPTDRLIANLLSSLARRVAGPAEWLQIDKLLQRFEVSKRLHGEYNSKWRPIDPSDYQGMETYLRFAELMDQAYLSSAKLHYLNALLKSIDTLTALVVRLDAQQFNRLKQLADSERDHVKNLAIKIRVDLTVHLEDKNTRMP